MADRTCLVAICTNWPYVPVQTTQSLMELGWGNRIDQAKAVSGFSRVDHAWVKGFPRVDALRDAAVQTAMAEGYSHLLFLDADNVWPTDVVERMLAHHDQGIVSGLYVQRGEPYAPIALTNGVRPEGSCVTHYWHNQDVIGAKGLQEVQAVGMGCTLIPMAVFDQIGPRPWFHYEPDDAGWPLVSEDIPFCRKAREAGFTVSVDPEIRCGHVGVFVVDDRWALRYQRAREATVERMPIKIQKVEPRSEAAS